MYLFVGVARPGDVLDALRQRHPDRVHARDELAVGAERVQGDLAHAGHDPHVRDDAGRVGDLDADVGDRRAERAHRERHDVHRPPLHAAVEQAVELLAHLGGIGPVVRRPRVVLVRGADERAVLDTRDVARVGAREVRVGALGVGKLQERAVVDELLGEAVVLLRGAVAPMDVLGLRQRGDLLDPRDQLLIRRRHGHLAHALLLGSPIRTLLLIVALSRSDRMLASMSARDRARGEARARARLRPGRNFRRGSGSDLTRGAFAPQGRRAAPLVRVRVEAGSSTRYPTSEVGTMPAPLQKPDSRRRLVIGRAPRTARSCSRPACSSSASRRSASRRPATRCARAGATARPSTRPRSSATSSPRPRSRAATRRASPTSRTPAAARSTAAARRRAAPARPRPRRTRASAPTTSRVASRSSSTPRSATSSARSPSAPAATRRSRSRRTRPASRPASTPTASTTSTLPASSPPRASRPASTPTPSTASTPTTCARASRSRRDGDSRVARPDRHATRSSTPAAPAPTPSRSPAT